MGTEPNATPASDIATLQERLETEAVTFVDTVNDELTALIEDTDHLGFDYLVSDVVGPFELCFEFGDTLGQVFALGHQYQPVSQLSWAIRVYLWVRTFDCSLLNNSGDTERSVTPHHWFSNSVVHRHIKDR